MAAAFTEQEKNSIRAALKKSAQECIPTVGMRGATVEQLAKSAGISKGAFYDFYESKERLFFEVMEDWHEVLYTAAMKVLEERTDLSSAERAAEAVLRVCGILEENSLMNFLENDLPYLLRKLPPEVLSKHYHSDEVHIREILRQSNLQLTVSPEVACAAVRLLFLSLTNQRQIGKCFPQVLELAVRSVCSRLISN